MGRDAAVFKCGGIDNNPSEDSHMAKRRTKIPENHPALLDLSLISEDKTSVIKFSGLEAPLWTEHKAKLISCYLHYFVLITKHGIYIDGFAGPQSPDQPESWAAKLVLENKPEWMQNFFLCDKSRKQAKALKELRNAQPEIKDRTIDVKRADFNVHIDNILATGLIGEKKATFCLLDQRTFECDWSTVQKIARHKSEMKIEIFYFVPTGWLARSMSGLNCPEATMAKWWGNRDWTHLQRMSKDNIADQFRLRFLKELNYKYAYCWPIYEEEGSKRVMYHMVHATDHKAAPRLMHRAYKEATKRSGPAEQLGFEF